MLPGAPPPVPPAPVLLPVLSAGRHRSPRRGACFMEMASYLAGERWSDHPSCTHPLLASAARHVNDRTSDAARPRLALLVPSVVGLTSDDPHLEPRLVRTAAAHALPVVAEPRQRALAVGVLTADRVLAVLDGRDPEAPEPATARALAAAPGARRWAERFVADQLPGRAGAPRQRVFARETAPHVVELAVRSVAAAERPDGDDLLRAMLTELVAVATAHAAPHAPVPSADRWAGAVRLVGAART